MIATDISSESLSLLKNECPKIKTSVLDVTNPEKINQIAEETGAIDVLFNCAGFVHHGTILDCDEIDWDSSFEINVPKIPTSIKIDIIEYTFCQTS